MINLKLLMEGALSRKAPYIKNTYGADIAKIKKSKTHIEEELSKILKQKVYINNNVDWKDGGYAFFSSKRNQSPTTMVYFEDVLRGHYEHRKPTTKRGDETTVGYSSDGKYELKTIRSYDKKWAYLREKQGNNIDYFVVKQSGKPIGSNPADSGDTWFPLRPGTKAYDAVKTKVFGD
jgi:hypothetical protein